MREKDGIFRRWVMAFRRRLERVGAMPVQPLPGVMEQFETESDPVRMFLHERTIADGQIKPQVSCMLRTSSGVWTRGSSRWAS